MDINLFKKDALEQLIPLDVNVVKPKEVTISDKDSYKLINHVQYEIKPTTVSPKTVSQKDTSLEPSHELSQDEIQKYLSDFYATDDDGYKPVVIESGFKPIKPQIKIPKTQPNTFRSNKQPQTTPGLRHYSTKSNINYGGKFTSRIPKINYGHSYWPSSQQYNNSDRKRAELTRMYRRVSNNGYTRYDRHIRFGY